MDNNAVNGPTVLAHVELARSVCKYIAHLLGFVLKFLLQITNFPLLILPQKLTNLTSLNMFDDSSMISLSWQQPPFIQHIFECVSHLLGQGVHLLVCHCHVLCSKWLMWNWRHALWTYSSYPLLAAGSCTLRLCFCEFSPRTGGHAWHAWHGCCSYSPSLFFLI